MLIFGDNQFFGVSHMSEERGMERMDRFKENQAIIDVIDCAYEEGIHSFSFSTHDRVEKICDHFRANPARYADLSLYPALPYAHKYASLVNDKGMIGAVTNVVKNQPINMLWRGSQFLFTQNPAEVMKMLVDAELNMFRGLNVKVIFLQNIVTDLILGMGISELFVEYAQYIEKKYQAKAGFMTLNMPRLVDCLLKAGFKDPIVCSAINKAGFQMNPDRNAYEKALAEKPFTAYAMSVMAAGAIPPKEAFEYVSGLNGVKAILFGASTPTNIRQTKEIVYGKS